ETKIKSEDRSLPNVKPLETAERIVEVKKLVRELAETVGLQAQVTNRIWLGMISVAGAGVLPRPKASDPTVQVLTFAVPTAKFFISVFAALFVLIVAFSAAYAAQARAQELAQSYLESLPPDFGLPGFRTPRGFYDVLRLPTFNRIAPLPQLLSGKYQLGKCGPKIQRRLRGLKRVYYWVLKIPGAGVYFVFPGVALIILGIGAWGYSGGLLKVAILASGTVACVTLLQVLVNDLRSGRTAANTVAKDD
ncbi:MAG TPA: hypothetical protein VGD60_15690, partial [Candidatus Acidoferrales bacterium]